MTDQSTDTLTEPETGRQFLFACTFDIWAGGGSLLDRHYNTYAIDSKGMWCGVVRGGRPAYYRIVDEFSGIAIQLILLDKWEEFATLWYDALSAALFGTERKKT